MQPKKRPNSLDVAKLAGVSQTTVSFVLNNRADRQISEEVKVRVWKAVEELGYRPNRLANALLRGKSQTIGILLPSDSIPFHTYIVNGIEETLASQGFRVLMAHNRSNPEHEKEEIQLLLDHSVDGIISCCSSLTLEAVPDWLQLLEEAQVPCCLLDDNRYHQRVDSVVSDDVEGTRAATAYLASLGHRRIVHFAGSEQTSSGRNRTLGFRLGLEEAGIAEEPWMVRHFGFVAKEWSPEQILEAAAPATAILTSNDDLAGVATMVLRESGRDVPGDVSIVGYSNSRWANWFGLTSVDQDPYEIGAIAARRILLRQSDFELPPVLLSAPVRLIVRTSCAPPRVA